MVFKMEIAWHENRMVTEANDTIFEIQDRLCRTMAAAGIGHSAPGTFYAKGDNGDYSPFGSATNMRKPQNGFMPLAEKWLWYTDTGVEDVAAHYKQSR